MADIPTFRNLSLERHGNVFVLSMQKPPENRLNSWYCQEMIRAYRTVERLLGPDSEGAVITRGNDAKFWCTVCTTCRPIRKGARTNPFFQGLELDEADKNPFANTDGFYPVRGPLESHKLPAAIRAEDDADLCPAHPYHPGLPIPNHRITHWPHIWRRLSSCTGTRLSNHEFTPRFHFNATRESRFAF